MLRSIPFPFQTVRELKIENGVNRDPMIEFQLRMRLRDLDRKEGIETDEALLNEFEIEALVLTSDWPVC